MPETILLRSEFLYKNANKFQQIITELGKENFELIPQDKYPFSDELIYETF